MEGPAPWEADACHDEQHAVSALLDVVSCIDVSKREAIVADARQLVQRARGIRDKGPAIDALLQEFGLSNAEGVALMCLAESLLRVPDNATADRLIAEKVRAGDWASHLRSSGPLFVNASAWGMLLTGRIVRLEPSVAAEPATWLRRLVGRLGEPAVRAAMRRGLREVSHRYVLGRSIEEARRRGVAEYAAGTRFSFDMLGEGARTRADAGRYFERYERAVAAVAGGNGSSRADSVSIKLSALHPRYRESHRRRVLAELLPRLLRLATLARDGGIALTIDAEEADRLPLSLELFERLARHPGLAGWNGLGLVLQAYQKRAPLVADWVAALARETGRQVPVRLVKGAYWDTEIKQAQQLGLHDYPVYTRKTNTDLAWLHCARKLLAAGDALYPQFATHNACSIAAMLHLAPGGAKWELQRLHGMGDVLYAVLPDHCRDTGCDVPPVRVYAPVGTHDELLPYLVRRLLENGANSSFVHRYLDESVPVDDLVRDIVAQAAGQGRHRHPAVVRPRDIYLSGEAPRPNAGGINLEDRRDYRALASEMAAFADAAYVARPAADEGLGGEGEVVACPAAPDRVVGHYRAATPEAIRVAMAAAATAQPSWDEAGGEFRAAVLDAVGRALAAHRAELMSLLTREAGKTLHDAQAEVREAVDFCHYYAEQARQHFAAPRYLTGPTGERNRLSLHGRGVFACISPWNFPLAIFVGQVVAALAAGNAVAAKPAEQTPLVAARAVSLMKEAGVPADIVQLLPGEGATVGAAILRDPHLAGVAFTGSTATARQIQRMLAEREGPIVPFIAETGGINAMIADTTCLPEQLVDDVIASAFSSAGQRCSALRVLFLPEVTAERILEMLCGACDELVIGDPWELATDIGPVIDAGALAGLREHVSRMRSAAVLRYGWPGERLPRQGHFFGPHILEIPDMAALDREVFGPILHVVRYAPGRLDTVLEQINACGYGLTLGVHSRIEAEAEAVFRHTRVGNTYVNRDMVGAVVGVNPFGGQGLSGTGPKAGGPHYLLRFATERVMTVNLTATGGNVDLLASTDVEGAAAGYASSPGVPQDDGDAGCAFFRGYN